MGGNALAPFGARRVSREVAEREYRKISELLDSLPAPGGTYRHELIRAYRQKNDFGDLDILVDAALFEQVPPEEFVALAERVYGREIPCFLNWPVTSIGVPLEEGILQVDLVAFPAADFDFAANYYAWNDLGNLMGCVAQMMGVRLKAFGLILNDLKCSGAFESLLVTKDFDKAIELLGFDSKRWREGFDTIEDIYRFVASGKRFHPDVYKLENRNHEARMRDRKRPVYREFLKWITKHEDELPRYEWNEERTDYWEEVFEAFPEAKAALEQAWKDLEARRQRKTRLSGHTLSEVTGITGEDLGRFSKHFYAENSGIKERLEEMTDEDIRKAIEKSRKTFDRLPGPSM